MNPNKQYTKKERIECAEYIYNKYNKPIDDLKKEFLKIIISSYRSIHISIIIFLSIIIIIDIFINFLILTS